MAQKQNNEAVIERLTEEEITEMGLAEETPSDTTRSGAKRIDRTQVVELANQVAPEAVEEKLVSGAIRRTYTALETR